MIKALILFWFVFDFGLLRNFEYSCITHSFVVNKMFV